MKIKVISHTYPTERDPSSGIFIQKEAHLIADFADIEVLIPQVYATPLNKQYYRSHSPVQENFPVRTFSYLSVPRKKLPAITQLSLTSNLLNTLKGSSNAIIHLHALYPSGISVTGLKKAGFKVVITIHGGDWYSNTNNDALMLKFHQALKHADHIITVGKELRKEVLNRFEDIDTKITHIPHGIDTDRFTPANSKESLKKKLNWDMRSVHLLSVANLYKVKGLHFLVRAFANLEKKDTHLHLITPRKHPEAEKLVDDIIVKNNLQDRITFYPSMSEKNIVKYYQAADLFISPSLKEGFGLAIAEAAACGTPVVATKSGGPEEIITPEIGVLVEPGDHKTLLKGIEQVLSYRHNYLPARMHKEIGSNFGLTQKKERLKQLYESIR